MILIITGTELLLNCKINQRQNEEEIKTLLFFIWRNNCPGIRRGRPKHMIARAFTNVYKYFLSLVACQTCTCLGLAPPLSNFKGAAKRAAAANFKELQILRELRKLRRLCKFCGLSNFKSSCDLTTARQLYKIF